MPPLAAAIAKGVIKKLRPKGPPKRQDTVRKSLVERLKGRLDKKRFREGIRSVDSPQAKEAGKQLDKEAARSRKSLAFEGKTVLKERGARALNKTTRGALGLAPKSPTKKAAKAADSARRNIEQLLKRAGERRN